MSKNIPVHSTVATSVVAAQGKKIATGWEERILIIGLVILGLVTRLPFTERILYHWDSVNFALGVQHFDVAIGQPHVPGYILYVYLARLVNIFFSDPPRALVTLSVASSSLAIVALYYLGKAMYDRFVGFVGAIFLAFSPLFWFYGEIALPHTLDALVVIIAIYLFYRILQGDYRLVLPAAIWMGLAGGLRPQTQVFLAPLALYVGLRAGLRKSLLALFLMVVVDLAWFIPLINSAGGLEYYFFVMGEFSADFNTTTSVVSGGMFGLVRNLRKLIMYSGYGWAAAALPVAFAVLVWLGKMRSLFRNKIAVLRWNGWRDFCSHWEREIVLGLWAGPVLAYYILIHMGQQGLVFVFLPALMLLSAVATRYLGWGRKRFGQGLIAAILLFNAAVFLLAPAYPLGSQQFKLLTLDTLRRHDISYEDRLDAVNAYFSPENSVVIAAEWRFPDYYLADYAMIPYELGGRWEADEGVPVFDLEEVRTRDDQPIASTLADEWLSAQDLGLDATQHGTFYLVIFDDTLLPYNRSSDRLVTIVTANGSELAYIPFSASEAVYLGPDTFEITKAKSVSGSVLP